MPKAVAQHQSGTSSVGPSRQLFPQIWAPFLEGFRGSGVDHQRVTVFVDDFAVAKPGLELRGVGCAIAAQPRMGISFLRVFRPCLFCFLSDSISDCGSRLEVRDGPGFALGGLAEVAAGRFAEVIFNCLEYSRTKKCCYAIESLGNVQVYKQRHKFGLITAIGFESPASLLTTDTNVDRQCQAACAMSSAVSNVCPPSKCKLRHGLVATVKRCRVEDAWHLIFVG